MKEHRNTPFEAIIFDVDGTLFQTERVALPAFQRLFATLQEKNLYHGDAPSDDKLLSVLGMTIPEIWETLLPDADMDVRDQANELFAHVELGLIREGVGELYPGCRETIQTLHDAGYKIFTASNGEERYVHTVIEETKLRPLFTTLYSAGEYKTEKKEDLVALLLQKENIRQAVMVGDRKSDIRAGRANNLPTIGCDFGFAGEDELEGATVIINSYKELLPALDQLAKQQS